MRRRCRIARSLATRAALCTQTYSFPLLRQQLDLCAGPGRLPGHAEERLLQRGEPALRGTDNILRPAFAQLSQVGFGGDAAVHYPDPPGLAVTGFDLHQEDWECGVVRRVARQDLVGQREALRGHDEGAHYLDAVRPVVATVAEPARVFVHTRRVALEVGAGQVVEQEVVGHTEEILLAAGEEREEGGLMHQQLIKTPVQGVLRHQRPVLAEQIPHRAARIPFSVQPPLAARGNEPIGHQH